MISQAAASILCQVVEGKTIGVLRELTAQQMLDLLEIPLTPRRRLRAALLEGYWVVVLFPAGFPLPGKMLH